MNSVQTGSLCAIFAAFLFSTKAIFIKQAYALSPLVDATTLMVLRMGSALPFFILICWLNRHHNQGIHIKDWLILVFAGLLGYYFASWLDFVGLMFISASLERIILFLYPTLTVLASSLIYRQKLNAKTWFAIFLSYGGTVLVMLQEGKIAPSQGNLWIGCSVVFASAVAFAAYLLLTPHLIKKFGSWNFNGLALSVACVGTLLHFIIGTTQPYRHTHAVANRCLAIWHWSWFFRYRFTNGFINAKYSAPGGFTVCHDCLNWPHSHHYTGCLVSQ